MRGEGPKSHTVSEEIPILTYTYQMSVVADNQKVFPVTSLPLYVGSYMELVF